MQIERNPYLPRDFDMPRNETCGGEQFLRERWRDARAKIWCAESSSGRRRRGPLLGIKSPQRPRSIWFDLGEAEPWGHPS